MGIRSQNVRSLGEVVSILEQEVAKHSDWSLAHWSIHLGFGWVLSHLAEVGEDLGARDAEGSTPSHFVAVHFLASELLPLLRPHTDLDACDDDGGAPVHRAAGTETQNLQGPAFGEPRIPLDFDTRSAFFLQLR